MDTVVTPSALSGTVSAIASKSDAHRLLICAAFADKATEIVIPESSQDIDATIGCLSALGAEINRSGEVFTVNPIKNVPSSPVLDCGESGSTLRFLLPVAMGAADCVSFAGHGRLPDRPIAELTEAMKQHGVSFSAEKLPFTASGKLHGGSFSLPGNISSQYITGLLLALPLCGGGEISLTTALESASYVDMTLFSLSRFGINAEKTETGWRIPSGVRFTSPGRLTADGDWSNAAFFLSAGAISGEVSVTGLNISSTQGDKAICDALRLFGADIRAEGGKITASHRPLRGCTIDLKNIPDLLPTLAVVASFAEGATTFTGGERLRIKESDRLSSVANMINALGGSAQETADGLIVSYSPLKGGTADGANDHRIVMAAAIAASVSGGETKILGSNAVNKSYPTFWDDFLSLGGKNNVV